MEILLFTGHVVLSPTKLVSVCDGDQLELTCTTTEVLLIWNLRQTHEQHIRDIAIQYLGDSALQSYHYTLYGINFNISRLSPPMSLPLVSRLIISPANYRLNGTEVTCVDPLSGNSSSTTINVISEDTSQGTILNLRLSTCRSIF